MTNQENQEVTESLGFSKKRSKCKWQVKTMPSRTPLSAEPTSGKHLSVVSGWVGCLDFPSVMAEDARM